MISAVQKPINSGFTNKSETKDVLKNIDLHNKVAIVTGGYSGIGLETTKALVAAGANVIIPYRWVQDLDDVVILRYFPDKIDFTENKEKTEFEFEDDDGFYDD